MCGKNEKLMVGVAEKEITPPIGSLMAAFPLGPERIPRRAKGVHDPLKAKAIVISDVKENICLCSCDLTMIHKIDVKRIRSLVNKQIPELPEDHIIIAATHTHSSAETCYLFGNTPNDPWVKNMDNKIAETIIKAFKNRVSATASFGKSQIELTFNRRISNQGGSHKEGEPIGPVDSELIVIRFNREDKTPIVILFNYTAHALTVGPGNFLYTADYPGVASSFVEKMFPEATALFFNGAAGNVNPRKCMRKDFKIMDEMGQRLGEEVIRIAKGVKRINNPSIKFSSIILEFPNRVDPSQKVKAELSCLALGDIIMCFIPGELFVEFQLEFKRKMKPHIGMIIGYANGWHGYIPTWKDYEIGGYGVDLYTDDPPEYSRTSLPKGAGEKIMDKILSLSHDIMTKRRVP